MSRKVLIVLCCNDCPQRFVCTPGERIYQSRAEAARKGWHSDQKADLDLCPSCMNRRMNAAIAARQDADGIRTSAGWQTRRAAAGKAVPA